MKKTHKLILLLLAVYFSLAHVTSRLEMSTMQKRSAQMETLLLEQAQQQQQILANQKKSMSSGQNAPAWNPDSGEIPDLV